jgi:FkbM family methyltransferase
MWLQTSSRFVEPRCSGILLGGLFLVVMLVACSGSDSGDSEATQPISSDVRSSRSVDAVDIVDFVEANEKLYSQFNEELIIRHFFQDERDGVFLDVGCAYPIKLSTTYYLEKHLGWSGIAIDAFHYYREFWAKERPETTLLTNAVGDKDNAWIKFHVAGEPSVSSVDKHQAEKWGGPEAVAIRVPTITLTKALEDHGLERIDFVSIDIEGAEPAALAGFDIDRFKPRLVCIEAHVKSDVKEKKILTYFSEHGYELIEDYLPHDQVNWYFTPSG